jgi:hypothetical protein
VKTNDDCAPTVSEQVEHSQEPEFSPAQTLQLRWLMDFIQTNNSTVFTLIQVRWFLIQRNQEMEQSLSTLTSELEELKKSLLFSPSKKSYSFPSNLDFP